MSSETPAGFVVLVIVHSEIKPDVTQKLADLQTVLPKLWIFLPKMSDIFITYLPSFTKQSMFTLIMKVNLFYKGGGVFLITRT